MEKRALDPIPCYYGSVNHWETDENDHLNVRFYAEKMNQALTIFLREAAVPAARVESQHIRFVQEARIAAPLRVDCVPVAGANGQMNVLSLMRQNLTEAPIAAFTTSLTIEGDRPADWHSGGVIPEWALPRGVDPADPYPEPADVDAARHLGFRTMGRGVIQVPECDSDRVMLRHHYIGRISDGMPNLWAFEAEDGELGGAVVEYRLNYRAPLHEGEIFHQLSGIRSLGARTQHMVHLMFNETTGELALSAEAVGVAMDLEKRKAVPVSDRRKAQMADLMLP